METSGIGSAATSATAGMRAAGQRLESASRKVAAGDIDPAVAVEMTLADQQFTASAAVLKTANAMTGKLLDAIV